MYRLSLMSRIVLPIYNNYCILSLILFTGFLLWHKTIYHEHVSAIKGNSRPTDELKRSIGAVINQDRDFDYKAEMKRLNAAQVEANDSRLVEIIRKYFIEPPSGLPYRLAHPDRTDSSAGQSAFVDRTLNHMVRVINIIILRPALYRLYYR